MIIGKLGSSLRRPRPPQAAPIKLHRPAAPPPHRPTTPLAPPPHPVSAGIRPRDEVAKESGLEVHARGGVIVDDELRTSDPNVFAIGEVALHSGMIYGLVAPGYDMANKLAKNLRNGGLAPAQLADLPERALFTGADMSTKLKLMVGRGFTRCADFGDNGTAPRPAKGLFLVPAYQPGTNLNLTPLPRVSTWPPLVTTRLRTTRRRKALPGPTQSP